ncbi:uncharacterized protein BXZ73DRAFT_35313, partial [Epithele typhae]|uniref:uncharacterized protein n=1 Tax=Epithele typhae TaxID=378194 RepID=UPI002007C77C
SKSKLQPNEAGSSFPTEAKVPYCHQCRNKARCDRMRCTAPRKSGMPCGLYFCQICVEVRYPELEFNPFATDFTCPRCTDTCNCTKCCKQRGEPYVSSR